MISDGAADDERAKRRAYMRAWRAKRFPNSVCFADRAVARAARLMCVGCGGQRSPRAKLCRDCTARARREFMREERAAARRENQRAWREANPDYNRLWRARNGEKVRETKRARGKVKRASVVADLMPRQRGRCAYCRAALGAEFHIDHIEPRSRGGSNRRRNLQLTCSACNIAKGATDPVAFAQSRGLLL